MPLIDEGTFNFCGGTDFGFAQEWSSERTINLYPIPASAGTHPKTRIHLVNRPGLFVFGTLPQSPVRALWAGNSRLFAIGGTHGYELNANGTVKTDFGAMAGSTGAGPCQIQANGNDLIAMDS